MKWRAMASERERSPLAARRRRWRRWKYRGAEDRGAEKLRAQFGIEPLRTGTVRAPGNDYASLGQHAIEVGLCLL